jgi:uncharacterized membrane protein YraQ (UPF0718 family)
VALRKTRPHFAAQVVFDSVGHKDRAAFALEMGGVKLGGVQYGFIERRQALGRLNRHDPQLERNIEAVLPLLFLPLCQLGKFPIGRGKVLKEEPLSLAVDFLAVQIVLVCPVSVVRDYSQFSP